MNSKRIEVPTEPIDFRAIRNEEGFRLWTLQHSSETIVVDINEEHFVVYEQEREGALFWLYLDDENFKEEKLIQICKEEGISYEKI